MVLIHRARIQHIMPLALEVAPQGVSRFQGFSPIRRERESLIALSYSVSSNRISFSDFEGT